MVKATMSLKYYHIALKEEDAASEAQFVQDIQGVTTAEVWKDGERTVYTAAEGDLAAAVGDRFRHLKDFFTPEGMLTLGASNSIILTKPGVQVLYTFAIRDCVVQRFSEQRN